MVVQWLALTPHSKKVLGSHPLGVTVKRHAVCGKCEMTVLKMSEGVEVRVGGCWSCLEPRAYPAQMQLG